MKKEWAEIKGNKFLKVKIDAVYQKGKPYYIGKLPADFLIEIYTVEPAIYDLEKETALAKTFDTPENYFKYRIDSTNKKINEGHFQRRENKTRVTKIAKWLNDEEYSLFPNTIIVTCDLLNALINAETGMKFAELEERFDENLESLCFLEEGIDENSDTYLYIPYNPLKFKSLLVIDGQHRLRGLEEAGKEIVKDYDVLVSFIIGFDRSIVAKLFYTINYEQKPVNKSLLYHLMGEFSSKSDIESKAFLHEVVRTLNEVEESPFHKRIKMLGVTDKSADPKDRKLMTVSQALLIDYLIGTISEKAKGTLYPPIFLYYFKKTERQIEIVRFLIKYFQAIKDINEHSWNDPDNSIICNTVSIGAFIRVMNFIFIKLFVEEFKKEPMEIEGITVDKLKGILRETRGIDFSKNGPYGKSSSGGSLNSLREEIIDSLSYFGSENYKIFVNKYRNDYLQPFNDWLKKV